MNYLVIKIATETGFKYIKYFEPNSGRFHTTEDIEEAIAYNSISAEKLYGVLLNACKETGFNSVEVVNVRR